MKTLKEVKCGETVTVACLSYTSLVAVAQAAQGAVVVVFQVVDGAARHAVGAFRLGDRRHEVLIGCLLYTSRCV